MKTIIFVLLMALAGTAHSYSRGDWQLIMTVVSDRHTTVAVGQFGVKRACVAAGEDWVEGNKAIQGSGYRNAFYVCSPQYIKK